MNSFMWISIRSWVLSLLFAVFISTLIFILYAASHSKEFRIKLFLLIFAGLVLFLLFFVNHQELYSFELGELLEEAVLLRDPQQFILNLYYQASFWSTFLLSPILFYNLRLYFLSSLTRSTADFVKFALTVRILIQVFSFLIAYRWIFPDWLLSLNSFSPSNNLYSFEPDRLRIYLIFFEEIIDLGVFVLGLNVIYYFSIKQAFFTFWKKHRQLLFFLFFLSSRFRVQQAVLTPAQFFMAFIVFDFTGFMVFLTYYLNLWKLKQIN